MRSVNIRTEYTFVGADYSQQEPRLMTFLSQDPKMLQAYQEGKDLYAIMGTGVWHNNYWDNMEHNEDGSSNVEGKKRRSLCKKLLLGIMYSMGPATTASNMNITKEEAEDIIDRFYKGFPNVKKFIDGNQEFVSKYGYVEDAWGRRRRLPDATLPERTYKKKNSSNFNPLLNSNSNYISDNDRKLFLIYEKRLKEAKSFRERDAINKDAAKNGIEIINNSGFISRAKRQCTNARIQGSAATMTKKAMILIDRDKELKSYGFRLLIGVHDELIGECLVEYADKCAERLSYLMKSAVADTIHNVPFKCDAEVEPSWYWNTYSHTIQKEYKDLLNKYSEVEAFDRLKEEHIELLEYQLREALNNND